MKFKGKEIQIAAAVLATTAVIALGVVLHGCGGGGGGGAVATTKKLHVNGSIGSGYTVALKPSFAARVMNFFGFGSSAFAAADPTVDTVIAIPMNRGALNVWQMGESVSSVIDPGTQEFSIALAENHDWLLMLINSQVSDDTRFVGSLALNTGSDDSLLNLPVRNAAISSLDLGVVSRPVTTSGDAISSGTVTATDFNLTADQLSTLAKTDDLFKNAKNMVNNYGNFGNAPTVYYNLKPNFFWGIHGTGYDTIAGSYSAPNQPFVGMSFQLDTNNTAVSMNTLCTAGTTTIVELYPPAAILDETTKTYDATHPLTNSGAVCTPLAGGKRQADGPENFMATDQYDGISYGFPAHFTSLPSGPWTWKEFGTTRAVFDIGTVNPPYYGPNNYPRGFVPSFKVNVDANQKILSVDVQWYYYDETAGTYVGPFTTTDPEMAVLKHFIQALEVKFDVTNGTRRTCDMYFDPATTSHVIPADFYDASDPNNYCNLDWYLNNPGFPDTDTGIMGYYETGGFGYYFDFFKPII
jgi:hypothetical protein